jgi:hypothetical protein
VPREGGREDGELVAAAPHRRSHDASSCCRLCRLRLRPVPLSVPQDLEGMDEAALEAKMEAADASGLWI